MFESDLFSGSWLGRTAHFNRIPILSRSITVTARKLKFGRLKLKTKKLNNMTTECHCQETEIWLALHLWRFIFFKLFSPSSRMKEKLILAPLSGTTSLSEWTVSVIRQEAKNHLKLKPSQQTHHSVISSCWNFLWRKSKQAPLPTMYLLTVHVETFSGDDLLRREGCPVCKSKPARKGITVSQIFNSLQQMQQMQHQMHNGESNFQLNNSLQLNKTGIYHLNAGYMWCNFSRFLGRNVARHARMNAAWCTSRSEWNIRYQNFKDVVNFG